MTIPASPALAGAVGLVRNNRSLGKPIPIQCQDIPSGEAESSAGRRGQRGARGSAHLFPLPDWPASRSSAPAAHRQTGGKACMAGRVEARRANMVCEANHASLIRKRWPNPVRDSGGQHDRRLAVTSQVWGDARSGSFHPDQT